MLIHGLSGLLVSHRGTRILFKVTETSKGDHIDRATDESMQHLIQNDDAKVSENCDVYLRKKGKSNSLESTAEQCRAQISSNKNT
jgi:hypothetical protein